VVQYGTSEIINRRSLRSASIHGLERETKLEGGKENLQAHHRRLVQIPYLFPRHCPVMAYDLDCDATAAADDYDDCLQYYISGIEGDAIRACLTAKYKLLHNHRLVVKDKLLRRTSAGVVFKRIDEGSQGHSTLHRVESCPDQASSSGPSAAQESQSSSLPAKK
jgi:hypothetical protein